MRTKKFAKKKIKQNLDEINRQKTIASILTTPGWIEIRNEVYDDIDKKIDKGMICLTKDEVVEAKKLAIEAKTLENFVDHIENYLDRVQGK